MKTLNTIFTLSLLLGGAALIAIAIISKAWFHLGTGAGLMLLSAAWRKEAKQI